MFADSKPAAKIHSHAGRFPEGGCLWAVDFLGSEAAPFGSGLA
jgi:hypothetical protein